MKKKVLAFLMSLAVVTGALAGCGQGLSDGAAPESEKDATAQTAGGVQEKDTDVTLNLYIPTLATYSEDAIAEVEQAASAHTSEKYGFKIKLNFSEIGNFEQVINLAMTTDQLDVTCYFTGAGQLSNYVHNGQLLDITDRFGSASEELKDTFTDAEMQASSMDGRIYGLVRKYQYGGHEVLVMNQDIVDEMGIDVSQITDMDSVADVLYMVHEAHPEIYALVPQTSAEMTWSAPWIGGIGLTSFAYANDVDATTVSSLFELDSFKEFCGYTRQWYQDGLIMPDAISNTQEGSGMVTAGAAFACFHNEDLDPLAQLYPNTVCSPQLNGNKAIPTDIGNLQYGISANSAHPDEAFTLLEALYTDPELATLLAYGIEGKHYVINEDGRADYPEGMTAETEPYGGFAATATYADYLILPVKASSTVEDYQSAVDEWDKSCAVSKLNGFFFDTSEYTDFITAYKNVEDKYKNALLTGSIGYDETIDTIKAELEGIGFYDMLAKVQQQADEFAAAQ